MLDYFFRNPTEWLIDKILDSASADLSGDVLSGVTDIVTSDNLPCEMPCLPEHAPKLPVELPCEMPCLLEDAPTSSTAFNTDNVIVALNELLDSQSVSAHVCEELADSLHVNSTAVIDSCKVVVDTQNPLAELLNITDKSLLLTEVGLLAGVVIVGGALTYYYKKQPHDGSSCDNTAQEQKKALKPKVQSKDEIKRLAREADQARLEDLRKEMDTHHAREFEGNDGRKLNHEGTITKDWASQAEASIEGQRRSEFGKARTILK